MKKHLPVFAAALLLLSISPVNANIISGRINGVITEVSGPVFPFAIGAPVTGSFQYDSDLLTVDSFGQHWTSSSDPSVNFLVNIDGIGFAGWSSYPNGLGFTVDANGLPLSGGAAGFCDLYIGSDALELVAFADQYVRADVTYTTPDTGATLSLMSMALAGALVGKRFARNRKDCSNGMVGQHARREDAVSKIAQQRG